MTGRGRRVSGPPATGAVLVLLAAALGATGCGGNPAPPPWPPGVRQVPDESLPLSPDEAIRTFHLPPGYRVELVASEPMIEDPIWIDQDPDGRLWVVEMRGFMPDNDGKGEREPVGRIVVLEDRDDDGRSETRTVFLDGLVLPRSVKVLDHGVLVAAPPHLWLARDTTGDLVADTKEAVREDFGRAEGNPEHNANGLLWAMDNWIYTSEHTALLRWRGDGLHHETTLPRGQWGLGMDDLGRVFRNWNDDPLRVDLLPSRYYARNPHLARTRGLYEQTSDDLTVWPARPTPGVNRGYRDDTLREDGSLAIFVAAGTPTPYRGDRLPDLAGSVFVTEPGGNFVRRMAVTEGAEGFPRARNAYAAEKAEFLSSTDERFRPVNLFSAADGTLYVVDMYRGVIQHGQYQSEYLRNYIEAHGLDRPIAHGRIYRVVHESHGRGPRPSLSSKPAAALVEALSHPNGWWRDTAQRLLVERGDKSVVPALAALAASAPDERIRLHALWTMDGLGASDPAVIERALGDASPHVRAAAVRIAEAWIGTPGHPIAAAVRGRASDESPVVRRQVAASFGVLPPAARAEAIASLLERHGDDPVVVDAAVSGLSGHEAVVLDRLLAADYVARHGDAVAMLAAALFRSGGRAGVERVLRVATDEKQPEGRRVALLRGAALGLTRTTFFGTPLEGARVSIARRPAALLALADAGRGDLSTHAAAVAAGLDWPGRPKATRDARPLTPEEQSRFAEGEAIYGNLCAACHQPGGGGMEGIAPPLAGSKWVLGRAGLAARIVLHGKEDDRLMPPLGTLTDEQVAAVLTYVRRAWGNTAPPVEPSLVREARGASTGRARPWTSEELEKVTQPDGVN